MISLYISISIFILVLSSDNFTEYKSEINLVIQGPGNLSILSDSFYLNPSNIIINGNLNLLCNKICYFDNILNNVTIKFDKQLESLENMFKDLNNIIEIDLSKLDTSKATTMASMFENCSNLEKITFGNINTSLVKSMHGLFNNCSKLISLDLSNLDTSSVTDMVEMFSNCKSLRSIDLSKFNTSKVETMLDMFVNCQKLISVNVSSFDTAKVKIFKGMFYICYALKYLDLSNFDSSSANNFEYMFGHCTSLLYINLKNFKIINGANLFFGNSAKIKLCANEENIQNVLKKLGKEVNCSDKCFNENIKIDLKKKYA